VLAYTFSQKARSLPHPCRTVEKASFPKHVADFGKAKREPVLLPNKLGVLQTRATWTRLQFGFTSWDRDPQSSRAAARCSQSDLQTHVPDHESTLQADVFAVCPRDLASICPGEVRFPTHFQWKGSARLGCQTRLLGSP